MTAPRAASLSGAPLPQLLDGAIAVVLPMSKAVLASRLNLTPQHFSRILHDLTSASLIEVSGRSIVIRNLDGLRGYEG